jgi:hypothetical protein
MSPRNLFMCHAFVIREDDAGPGVVRERRERSVEIHRDTSGIVRFRGFVA